MATKELLDQAYLENKVNSLIEPMIMQLVSIQPDDPVQFMLQWIRKNYGDRTSFNQSKRFELEQLRKEVAKVDKEERKGKSSDSSDSDSSSDNSSDDEAVKKAKERKEQKGWKPRSSVSAEAHGEWNKKGDYTPIVIEKEAETITKIKNKILHSFMFNGISENDITIIINAMKVVNVKEGDFVIKQGDDGDEMYVVESGRYTCSKVFSGKTESTFLRYYQAGEAFGELCLLYNCPRAASIKALENGVLYALDRSTFNYIVKDAAIRRREKYEEFLASVDLLKGMESYERISLADAVIEEQFKEGDYIIRQGDEGERFYFILSGEAKCTKRIEAGKAAVEVMQYSKGSYFGELALIHNAPRAANVIAKTDTVVVSLDKDSFKRIMGTAEELLQKNIEKYEQYEKYRKLEKDLLQNKVY